MQTKDTRMSMPFRLPALLMDFWVPTRKSVRMNMAPEKTTAGEDREAFGQRVRVERDNLGLTQAELGAELEVHESTVSNWETGDHYPQAKKMRALAAFLNVTVLWLRTGREEQHGDTHRARERRDAEDNGEG
jgi:ribosome-binding protein aMBF1 (putative translation factor)